MIKLGENIYQKSFLLNLFGAIPGNRNNSIDELIATMNEQNRRRLFFQESIANSIFIRQFYYNKRINNKIIIIIAPTDK